MRRLHVVGRAMAWWIALAVAGKALAQGPVPSSTPDGSAGPAAVESVGPSATPPMAASPRTDCYSVYSDAFFNPHTADPGGSESGGFMDRLYKAGSYTRLYVATDAMAWTRSNPGNVQLVTISNNVFPFIQPTNFNPGGTNRGFVQANTKFVDAQKGAGSLFYPAASSKNPNDPLLAKNTVGFLSPGAVAMETNDFAIPFRLGVRPRIGLELPSGNQVEFSYFWFKDFNPATLAIDASNSQFLTNIIGTNSYTFQRMGYLNAPFTTRDTRFQGQTRSSSFDPREPTNADVVATTPGLLWTDGEVAIANYSFDIQGAEIAYKRQLWEYERWNWKFTLLPSVRYFDLNEGFTFFFADTATTAPSPQPVSTVVATYTANVDNKMIGPEIGIGANLPMYFFFTLDATVKAGYFANFLTNKMSMIRGDEIALFNYTKNIQRTSGAIEGQLGVTFQPHPNIKIRGGWEYLWMIGVGTATNQIEFDLTQFRRPRNQDSVLFNGWYGGFEVTF